MSPFDVAVNLFLLLVCLLTGEFVVNVAATVLVTVALNYRNFSHLSFCAHLAQYGRMLLSKELLRTVIEAAELSRKEYKLAYGFDSAISLHAPSCERCCCVRKTLSQSGFVRSGLSRCFCWFHTHWSDNLVVPSRRCSAGRRGLGLYLLLTSCLRAEALPFGLGA